MNNDIKQIIKKINYKEFDIELSYFQKWCISVIVSLAIVYLMFDPMNNFLRTFQSGGYIAFFAILLWFVCPFLAFASTKGSISFLNKSDWALFAKAFFKSIIVCLFSLLLCIFFFLTGCITLMVRYTYFVGLVSFLFFILNYIFKEKPFVHKKSENKITIFGPINSGKTVFLIILIRELIKDNSWEFEETKATPLLDMYSDYIRKGLFPPGTDVYNMMDEKFSWDISIAKKKNRDVLFQPIAFSLNVTDSTGGFFDQYDSKRFINDSYGYFERVSKSSALILILPADYEHSLDILNKALQENFKQILKRFNTEKIPIPVAICMSKIDNIYQKYVENHKKNPIKMFEEKFNSKIMLTIDKYLKTYEFFCFSAVGIEKENGHYQTLLRKDENNIECPPKDGKLKPFGLIEPIDWFVKCLNR